MSKYEKIVCKYLSLLEFQIPAFRVSARLGGPKSYSLPAVANKGDKRQACSVFSNL